MDCLFNKRVPKSTNIKIIIPPAGKTFITGFAKSYKDEFPEELELYKISKEEYAECMKDINELLQHYWPCKYHQKLIIFIHLFFLKIFLINIRKNK